MATAQDALIKAIEEDALAQSSRIAGEAEEAAGEIAARADAEVSILREERLKELAAEIERRRSALLNSARTKTNGLKIAAKREVMEGVLNAALTRFRELPSERYAALLGFFYEETKRSWQKDRPLEKPVVLLNPSDMGLLKDAGVEFRPDESVSIGVVFVSEDLKMRYENTAVSRLKRARAALEPLLNSILFG